MKYKNYINALLAAAVISGSVACTKKDLDRFPSNSIELGKSFQNMTDAKAWNDGFYASFRGRVAGAMIHVLDVQADQLNATVDYGNNLGAEHRMDNSFLSDNGTIAGHWSSYYGAITNLNIAIKGFPTIPIANATEQTTMNNYKGDAHFLRAYYYFNLVKRYAKAYNAATAATDLAVPLVLEYDVNARPARNTVKQIYDQIFLDITTAKSLITRTGAQGSKRITTDAITALEARVKLYTLDYTGAKAAADALIASAKYPLYTTAANVKAMWRTDIMGENILTSNVTTAQETIGTNGIYLGYRAADNRYRPNFIPSMWVINKYDDADFRKFVYFDSTFTVNFTTLSAGRNIFLINKYPGNPALQTSAVTNYMHFPQIFRIAEMYLISAEAGSKGDAAAQADGLLKLNAVRQARGLAAVNVSGAALMQEVKDERFRELAFEGFRLDDLKRWGDPIQRSAPQNTLVIVTNNPSFHQLNVPANDNRFTWAVPFRDMETNPNLSQNPGW